MGRRIFLSVAVLLFGNALTIALLARDDPQAEPKELPWMVKLNVMGDGVFSPQRFKVAVGDYIELSASLPPQGNQAQLFPMEHKVQGDAVVELGQFQPGTLTVIGFAGNQDGMNFGFRPMNNAGTFFSPVVLLRASKVGKCTLSTTVERGDKWKEVRDFEIEVTSKREDQDPIPFPKSNLRPPFGPRGGMGMGMM